MDLMDIMMAKALSGGGGGGGTGGGDILPVMVERNLIAETYSTNVSVSDVLAAAASGKIVLYVMHSSPINNCVYAQSYIASSDDGEVTVDFAVGSIIHDADGVHEAS